MEGIKNDMLVLHVEMPFNIAEWKKMIHLANPKNWEKGSIVLVVVIVVH